MQRDEAVDDLVNCVVRRGDQDMILKPSLMITSMVLPFILGILLAFAVLILYLGDKFPEEDEMEFVTIIVLTAILVEFAVFSFMTFCMSRRNRNHLKRDLVWMDSLCNFVTEHGGDNSRMRAIEAQNRFKVLSVASKISMGIWLTFILMLVAEGFILHMSDPFLEESILGFAVWMVVFLGVGFFLSLIQLFLTVGAIFGMPARHDKIQCDFTEEFVKEARKFGFHAEPMRHTVKRRKIWIHVILMIVTFGIYTFIYFIIACKDSNRHIHEQWAYEERLVQDMIRFVGGKGIEQTDEGIPNRFVRILNNLM